MNPSSFFSASTSTSSRKRHKTAAGRLINSITESEVVPDVTSKRANPRTYAPGQGLLDFDITSSSDDGGEDEVGYQDNSFTLSSGFSTPNNSDIQNSLTPLSRSQCNTRPSNNDMAQLFSMLQQQQATLRQHGEVLKETLSNQLAMSAKVKTFEKKLASLDNKCDEVVSGQSGEPPKKKIKVSRDVSKKVYMIHDELELKFKVDESISTAHNKKVAEKLISEVASQPGSSFDLVAVKRSVQRCFENKRRKFLEGKKENCNELLNKNRKYRSRRQLKYYNRSQVVTEKEKKYWEQLSVACMTEESDDPDNPVQLVVRKLPWRSQRVNAWMELLDKRYRNKQKSEGIMFPKKPRIDGPPSESPPPVGLPNWALDKDWNAKNGPNIESQDTEDNTEENFELEN